MLVWSGNTRPRAVRYPGVSRRRGCRSSAAALSASNPCLRLLAERQLDERISEYPPTAIVELEDLSPAPLASFPAYASRRACASSLAATVGLRWTGEAATPLEFVPISTLNLERELAARLFCNSRYAFTLGGRADGRRSTYFVSEAQGRRAKSRGILKNEATIGEMRNRRC